MIRCPKCGWSWGKEPELGDLFGTTKTERELARRHDPFTSYEAARAIVPKLPKLKREVFGYFLTVHPRPLTSLDVEDHFGTNGSTYRTRISELEEEGYLIKHGYVRQKGKSRVLWVINLKRMAR